jgi:hypothetical protein
MVPNIPHRLPLRSCMSFPIPFLTDPLPAATFPLLEGVSALHESMGRLCIFNPYVPSRDFHSHIQFHILGPHEVRLSVVSCHIDKSLSDI